MPKARVPYKNGIAERPQTLRYPEVKIIIPLKMAKAQAAAIFDRPALHPYPLRGAGDGGQQGHKALFVHLAAVGGKGVVAPLHAEGKHHFAHYVRLKGGVGLGDALAHGLLHPVDEQPLPGAGEEHADLGLMRGEGAEHLPRKPLGALAHIAGGQAGQAFHHRVHHLVLHGVGQRIDILIMGVECGFIDAGTVAQLLDTDLFHRLFAAQLHKGLLDGALGLFNADIQKTHLFCIFVDFPTFFRFCG